MHGENVLKIYRLLTLAAFIGASGSVALAQTYTDPKPFTQGCGGKGQPACDANIITSPTQTVDLTNPPLTFEQVGNSNEYVATTDILNDTGANLNTFKITFVVTGGLSFEGLGTSNPCTTPPGQQSSLFTCTPDFTGTLTSGFATYTFSGHTLCSLNSDDFKNGVYVDDHDQDDTCSGAIIGLVGINGSNGDSGITNGETVTAFTGIPEPSSAVLLLFGIAAAGLLSLKKLTLI